MILFSFQNLLVSCGDSGYVICVGYAKDPSLNIHIAIYRTRAHCSGDSFIYWLALTHVSPCWRDIICRNADRLLNTESAGVFNLMRVSHCIMGALRYSLIRTTIGRNMNQLLPDNKNTNTIGRLNNRITRPFYRGREIQIGAQGIPSLYREKNTLTYTDLHYFGIIIARLRSADGP